MISPKAAIDFIFAPDPATLEVYLPYIGGNSKGLTIPLFWFKLKGMRGLPSTAIRFLLLSAGLVVVSARPLFSAVKQVRVTQERASIYIEPSRTSARIDIVAKGTVLNLLQESKVKAVWYYVSYNSPRYGSRISGFIQDSAVELAVPGSAAPPPAKEEKAVPKIEPEKPRPAEAVPPAPVKEKEEPPKVPPAPPRIVESLAATRLPRGRTYSFPRQTASLQEMAWRIIEPPPVMEKTPPVIEKAQPATVKETQPKKSTEAKPAPPEVSKKPVAKEPEPKPKETKPAPKPAPPEVSKKPPAREPEPKPAEPQPVTMPQVRPPRKGPGFLSLGLGFGSSFGGAGGCLQLNSAWGLSLHAGVGLYPTRLVYSETDWVENEMLWSIGLKYYLPIGTPSFSPFIDAQYGGLKVEAAQVIIGIWDYQYVFSHEQKSLWGPSLLAGVELRLGHLAFSGAVGAAYATTSWDFAESRFSFVFDTGLMVHF